MFRAIDDWLFEKIFQPFADWFCDNTDRNHLWLTATFAYLCAFFALYSIAVLEKNLISNIVIILTALFVAFISDRYSSVLSSKTSSLMNPLRQMTYMFIMRISGIFISVLLISDIFRAQANAIETIVGFLSQFSLLCSFYFNACETKPPTTPKEKEAPNSSLTHPVST